MPVYGAVTHRGRSSRVIVHLDDHWKLGVAMILQEELERLSPLMSELRISGIRQGLVLDDQYAPLVQQGDQHPDLRVAHVLSEIQTFHDGPDDRRKLRHSERRHELDARPVAISCEVGQAPRPSVCRYAISGA